MKKSNLIYITLILTVVLILTANTGLCVDEIAQHVPSAVEQVPVKTQNPLSGIMTKFILTMAGVILSSIVIWGGLSIYNRFFVPAGKDINPLEEEDLNTPKTIEDAVTFFIKRNKLK